MTELKGLTKEEDLSHTEQEMNEYRQALASQFESETGVSITNSQGEPDIEYVTWLENKLIELVSGIMRFQN